MSVNFNSFPQNYSNTNKTNENFGAISPEAQAKLKQAESTAKDVTGDSFVGSFLNNLGIDVKHPKKAILSILGAVIMSFGIRAGFTKIIRNDGLVKATNAIGDFFKEKGFIKSISKGIKDVTADGKPLGNVKKLFTTGIEKFKNSVIMTGKNGPRLAMIKTQLKGTLGEVIDTITDFFRTMLKNQDADAALRKLVKNPADFSTDSMFEIIKNTSKTHFGSKQQKNALKAAIREISKRTDLDETAKTTIKNILKAHSNEAVDDGIKAVVKLLKNPNTIASNELISILQDGAKTQRFTAAEKDIILNIVNSTKATRKNSQKELIDIVNVLRQTQKQNKNGLEKILKKLLGNDSDVTEFIEGVRRLSKDDSLKVEEFEKFYREFIKARGLNPDDVNTKELLKLLSKDGDIAKITGITEGGWLMKQNVNLADAIKRFAIIHGDTADSGLAKLLQNFAFRSAEGVSNGVASRTLFGTLMALNIYNGVFNKTQDAPKGEKIATFADEAITDMGNYMMLPLAGSIIYKLGNLKDLKVADGDGIITKGAKWIAKQFGKLLSMGLGDDSKKFAKVFGGAGRAIGVLLIVSPFLMKPIMKLSRAIFGKTTEIKKQEEEARQKKEAKKHPQQQAPQLPTGGPTNYLEMIDAYNKALQQSAQPQQQVASPQTLQETPTAAAPAIPTSEEIPARKINNDANGQNSQVDDPNRSYVPNPVQALTKATTQNYKQSSLEVALQQASNAEKLAEKFV